MTIDIDKRTKFLKPKIEDLMKMSAREATFKLGELLNPEQPHLFDLDYDFGGKVMIKKDVLQDGGRFKKLMYAIQLDKDQDYTLDMVLSLKERIIEFFDDQNNFLNEKEYAEFYKETKCPNS